MAKYRSRFAPTPSGPLHLGSLFAAVVSYLDAKQQGGDWLVRIDDIDPPREQPGATESILRTLESHGLYWDEQVSYQSQHSERYEELLEQLRKRDRLFCCSCSRQDLKDFKIYPGNCRSHRVPRGQTATRLEVRTTNDAFEDLFQGYITADPKIDYGDVILKRKDNLYAYQLASVADDIADQISHIIRGIDLIDSVFWQREIYHVLKLEPPVYGHFAVIHGANSEQKLSKQNLAAPVNSTNVIQNLQAVFELMGMQIDTGSVEHMIQQAVSLWSQENLTNIQLLQLPIIGLNSVD